MDRNKINIVFIGVKSPNYTNGGHPEVAASLDAVKAAGGRIFFIGDKGMNVQDNIDTLNDLQRAVEASNKKDWIVVMPINSQLANAMNDIYINGAVQLVNYHLHQTNNIFILDNTEQPSTHKSEQLYRAIAITSAAQAQLKKDTTANPKRVNIIFAGVQSKDWTNGGHPNIATLLDTLTARGSKIFKLGDKGMSFEETNQEYKGLSFIMESEKNERYQSDWLVILPATMNDRAASNVSPVMYDRIFQFIRPGSEAYMYDVPKDSSLLKSKELFDAIVKRISAVPPQPQQKETITMSNNTQPQFAAEHIRDAIELLQKPMNSEINSEETINHLVVIEQYLRDHEAVGDQEAPEPGIKAATANIIAIGIDFDTINDHARDPNFTELRGQLLDRGGRSMAFIPNTATTKEDIDQMVNVLNDLVINNGDLSKYLVLLSSSGLDKVEDPALREHLGNAVGWLRGQFPKARSTFLDLPRSLDMSNEIHRVVPTLYEMMAPRLVNPIAGQTQAQAESAEDASLGKLADALMAKIDGLGDRFGRGMEALDQRIATQLNRFYTAQQGQTGYAGFAGMPVWDFNYSGVNDNFAQAFGMRGPKRRYGQPSHPFGQYAGFNQQSQFGHSPHASVTQTERQRAASFGGTIIIHVENNEAEQKVVAAEPIIVEAFPNASFIIANHQKYNDNQGIDTNLIIMDINKRAIDTYGMQLYRVHFVVADMDSPSCAAFQINLQNQLAQAQATQAIIMASDLRNVKMMYDQMAYGLRQTNRW